MATAASILPAANAGAGATAAAAAAKAAADAAPEASQDRFLTLLVAQMRHQDPLNPMDNAAVTSQMAQISTVSGIDRLNATLKALAGGFSESQSLEAASLVGREVLVSGSTLSLAEGSSATRGGFVLDAAADAVDIVIQDAAGSAVNRVSLGPQGAGLHSFEWDGASDAGLAMPPGSYKFSIVARNGANAIAVSTLAAGRVVGVSRDASGPMLELSGLGPKRYADIKQIL